MPAERCNALRHDKTRNNTIRKTCMRPSPLRAGSNRPQVF
jgi:hypothetical protein